jgi:hypothetical protein
MPRAQARAGAGPWIGNFGDGRQGGVHILPGDVDIGAFGERIRRQMEQQREQLEKRGIVPRFGRGFNLNDPELIEKFDADGDGKLSPMERGKARAEGAVPEHNLDFDIDLGFGAVPNLNELLRDARRSGSSSSWSSVTGSAHTKVVSIDDEGSFEYSSEDGKKRFKGTSPDGEVLFEGPVNTDAQRNALPEGMLERLETLEGNVKIRINQGGKHLNKPKSGLRKNNKLL